MSAPKFTTLGCRLNAYETEAMKELSQQAGLTDAVVVNTCAVTAEAVRKARQEIRKLRRENPNARLIVTGCAAQTEPETFSRMDEVDAVIGNTEKMQPDTWKGMAADFIGETETVQVDDIMSVTETAGHLIDGFGTARVLMCRSRMAVIIAVPSASFPMAVGTRAACLPVWWWIRSSGWWTVAITR